ncbi:MAG: 1-deoxy-D-xylulose-5-phosphate reductoisomerase [Bacteroidota bacterium]|nr:1-deoxy-D-xylulose-5-phosphate reductoisomerase [Bacteroidota bacterium]
MDSEVKKIGVCILGSTGSIGTQALDVIAQHTNLFHVAALAANNSTELLIKQAIAFKPDFVVIANTEKYLEVFNALDPYNIIVYAGADALNHIVSIEQVDVVLTAMVGAAGLIPTISAIKAGKRIALANKETLVVAGQYIIDLCIEYKSHILPVDSEHSAIFQCLVGENIKAVKKLILTASGGPFRDFNYSELENVSIEQALKHPKWKMGAKISIDSATLMNKGLEVIEARWLFGIAPTKIDIVVHPQSIIHSLVHFNDGSIKAQLGNTDMRMPIQYALAYPHRPNNNFNEFDLVQIGQFTFAKPDISTFQCLSLAYEALERGGNACCALNAANEIAVDAFLQGNIKFTAIPKMIEETLYNLDFIANPSIDQLLETDKEVRSRCLATIV